MTAAIRERESVVRHAGRAAPWFAALAAFLVFLPALRNGFVNWDDKEYVLLNTHLESLNGELIVWAFSSFYADLWIPLTWLSLALDHALWGLNPLGYHLTNVVLHSCNVFLVCELCRELLSAGCGRRAGEAATGGQWGVGPVTATAALAALFWGLHPLRVESVAWIVERKDVLNAFFALPALLFYLRYAASGGKAPGKYLAAFVFFSLSLLSKPISVTLPVIFLVLDWFPLRRIPREGWRPLAEKVPFLILSAAAASVTLAAQLPRAMQSLEQVSLLSRLLIAGRGAVAYLGMTIWPTNLSPFHLHPGNVDPGSPGYLLPMLLCALITAGALALAKRAPVLLAVWLCFLVALAPVSGILQAGPQEIADRFTYLPGISLALPAALGAYLFAAAKRFSPLRTSAVAALLLFYALTTVRQIPVWKDPLTLWGTVIEARPGEVGLAYINRGLARFERGEYRLALADISVSLEIARKKAYPRIHELYYHRARVHRRLGNAENAAADTARYREELAKYEKSGR